MDTLDTEITQQDTAGVVTHTTFKGFTGLTVLFSFLFIWKQSHVSWFPLSGDWLTTLSKAQMSALYTSADQDTKLILQALAHTG